MYTNTHTHTHEHELKRRLIVPFFFLFFNLYHRSEPHSLIYLDVELLRNMTTRQHLRRKVSNVSNGCSYLFYKVGQHGISVQIMSIRNVNAIIETFKKFNQLVLLVPNGDV